MKRKNTILGAVALLVALAAPHAYGQSQMAAPETAPESLQEAAQEAPQEAMEEALMREEAPPADSGKDNLFGVIKQGGAVMFIILGMFLVGMTMAGERAIFYCRTKAWNKETLEERLTRKAGKSESLYREELDGELRDHAQLYFNQLEKGLNLIHGIGNLAPLVGFFGTVIGMIKAFAAIATAAVVNAKVVAVGIQIALVTTAGGLAVAVFTLSFYHLYAHIVQNQAAYADEFIENLSRRLPPYSQQEASR